MLKLRQSPGNRNSCFVPIFCSFVRALRFQNCTSRISHTSCLWVSSPSSQGTIYSDEPASPLNTHMYTCIFTIIFLAVITLPSYDYFLLSTNAPAWCFLVGRCVFIIQVSGEKFGHPGPLANPFITVFLMVVCPPFLSLVLENAQSPSLG